MGGQGRGADGEGLADCGAEVGELLRRQLPRARVGACARRACVCARADEGRRAPAS